MEVGVRVEYNGSNGIIDKISKNEDTNKPAYTIRYDDGETQCVEFDGCDKLKVISEGESLFMSWVKAATAEAKEPSIDEVQGILNETRWLASYKGSIKAQIREVVPSVSSFLSICPSTFLSTCLRTCLSTCVSTCRFICLSSRSAHTLVHVPLHMLTCRMQVSPHVHLCAYIQVCQAGTKAILVRIEVCVCACMRTCTCTWTHSHMHRMDRRHMLKLLSMNKG